MKLGLAHSTMFEADGSIADPMAVARHVEDLGLDSLWVSDHLAWGTPILDSVVALTAGSAFQRRRMSTRVANTFSTTPRSARSACICVYRGWSANRASRARFRPTS